MFMGINPKHKKYRQFFYNSKGNPLLLYMMGTFCRSIYEGNYGMELLLVIISYYYAKECID